MADDEDEIKISDLIEGLINAMLNEREAAHKRFQAHSIEDKKDCLRQEQAAGRNKEEMKKEIDNYLYPRRK